MLGRVPKWAAALALLAALAPRAGAARTADDPHSLAAEAHDRLGRGDVDGAESSIARLRGLLASDPLWDPDGVFASRLLPDLEAGVARLRAAARDLDSLPARMDEKHALPPRTEGSGDVDAYVTWGRTVAAWIRAELERIEGSVAEGPERGALLQSRSHEGAARLLESRVLPAIQDVLAATAVDRLPADERIQALKSRLESIKREMVASSVERQSLKAELAGAMDELSVLRRRLIEFIGYEPAGPEDSEAEGQPELGAALSARLRSRMSEMRSLEKQTMLERMHRLEELERFRLANVLSVFDGARDLSGGIVALAAAIENVPVSEEGAADPSRGWLECCLSTCRR